MVRFKNRYVAIEVNPIGKSSGVLKLNSALLHTSIISAIEKYHGDFGVAAIRPGLTSKYCNEITRVALIRSRHGPHKLLISILPLIEELCYHKVHIHTLYVGATLNQCYRFLRNYQKQQLMKIWSSLETDELKQKMEKNVMDLTPVISFDERCTPETKIFVKQIDLNICIR